jgi:hypothetical protein
MYEKKAFQRLVFALFCIAFALLIFHGVFGAGRILLTTDDNIGDLAYRKARMPFCFAGTWKDAAFFGNAGMLLPGVNHVLLWLLPLRFFVNWVHAFNLIVGSVFFGLFLRLRGRSWYAVGLGALLAFWAGSNFTLVYAGHMGKFGVLMLVGLYLWLIETAVVKRSPLYAVLAGGTMGTMFLEQADVGLFFSLILGLYTVYAVIREYGLEWAGVARIVPPVVVVALIIAIHPLLMAYSTFSIGDKTAIGRSGEEQWAYCTQWSWPPEETIDFIAPGYTGWRSGEPEGPYWGRMGRAEGWEETGQGFRNFKLETFYLGAVGMIFAAGALFGAFKRFGADRKKSLDIFFWSGAVLLTFLLALGKFFPLYRAFYALPGMSSIRNPVKFMQVTQVGLAVLGAFGFDWLLVERKLSKHQLMPFLIGLGAVGVILIVTALLRTTGRPAVINALMDEGWGNMAPVIADNMIRALWHAVLMALGTGGVIVLFAWGPWRELSSMARIAAGLLVFVVAVDLYVVSRHYVKIAQMEDYVGENEVIRVLKQELSGKRSLMFTQSSFYNLWLTYTFPYHGILSFNVPQTRMPADYDQFLKKVGNDIVKMAQLGGIECFLGPAQSWAQIQQDPRMKGLFSLLYAYNVAPTGGGGISVISGSPAQPGRHCILQFEGRNDRFALVGDWEVVSDETALDRVAGAGFRPLRKVLVTESTAGKLPASTGGKVDGSIEVLDYRADRFSLRVATDKAAILRVGDKYAPEWLATVNERPVRLLRCDFLFRGVYLEPGVHTVTFDYDRGKSTLGLMLAGYGLCAASLAGVLFWRDGKRDAPLPEPAA